jgi:hypothetical protein
MRRLLSISLFAAMLLPVLAPLFSFGADAQTAVLACCRREGKHHCMMGGAALPGESGQSSFRSPREVCPYQQRGLAAAHYEPPTVTATPGAFAVLLDEAKVVARAECLRRICFDRARQKRGPPALLS